MRYSNSSIENPSISNNLFTMKNLIITGMLFVAFLFTQQTNAQVNTGIVAGTGVSEMIGDNAVGFGKNVFNIGIQTDFHLNERIALSTGLVYAQKGSQVKDVFQENSSIPAHASLTYVQAPLMLKIKSDYGLFVQGGATFGRLLSANLDAFNAEKNNVEVIEDQFNPWEIGATAMFGYQVNPSWEVTAGWSQSLNSIFDGELEGKNALQNHQFNVQLTFFPFN